MTISKRLLALVATAIVTMGLLVGLNLYQSAQIYESASYGTRKTVPSLRVLDQAAGALAVVRVRLYRYALLDDVRLKAELEPRIAEARGALEAALAAYEPLVADAEDRRLLDRDRAVLPAFQQGADQIVAAARRGDRTQAIALLMAHVGPSQAVVEAIEAHAAYDVKLGQSGGDAAQATRRLALQLGLGALAVLGLGVQGYATIRRITGQLNSANAVAARVAEGDLRRGSEAAATGNDEIGQLLTALERMRARLSGTVDGIVQGAEHVLASASDLQSTTRTTSAAAEQQSNSISEAAAAVEELTTSIEQVAGDAADASAQAANSRELAASSAQSVADAGAQVGQVAARVEDTAARVGALSNDVLEIGKITVVIREVAEQTNLLALNAAIEAARAGEQGRGFAVVADEVRKLAERTTGSVQDISRVIGRIQQGATAVVESMESSRDVVGSVVATAGRSGEAMHGIVGAADGVGHALASVSAALGEQRLASANLARNVESIAQMAEQNARAVGRVSETSESLRGIADTLRTTVGAFRV